MPFTPSHVAAILPFVRSPLPAAALVAGSMMPDLPYFIPLGIPRNFSHSLVGLPVADIPMGIAALLLWVFVFRAPLLSFAPDWLRLRFPITVRRQRDWPHLLIGALLVLAGLAAGILTHFLWDAFTHADGWVVLNVGAFRVRAGPWAVYRWAQYLSSLAGLVILAVWIVRWVRRTGPRRGDPDGRQLSTAVRRTGWVVVAAVAIVVAAAIWIAGLIAGDNLFDRYVIYAAVTYAIAIAGALAIVTCLGWYLLPKRESRVG
ncbi:MAG: cell wall anchor protein [Microbacteriaceae bacterium]|nr:cell wall anchor protein [Microbacteriaceae bacterium]